MKNVNNLIVRHGIWRIMRELRNILNRKYRKYRSIVSDMIMGLNWRSEIVKESKNIEKYM